MITHPVPDPAQSSGAILKVTVLIDIVQGSRFGGCLNADAVRRFETGAKTGRSSRAGAAGKII
ncbi:MAG: hypothetical protein Kow0020_06030 [Wenzhouxiangellaceae bacterium]